MIINISCINNNSVHIYNIQSIFFSLHILHFFLIVIQYYHIYTIVNIQLEKYKTFWHKISSPDTE